MRSQRLLALLHLLEGSDWSTAERLAEETGVAIRTIYRDMAALAATRVPIETEIGPGGGYRLRRDYSPPSLRVTDDEATAVLLAGFPGIAEDLLDSSAVGSGRQKLERIMSAGARSELRRLRRHLYIDLPGWNATEASPKFLNAAIRAALANRKMTVRYLGWQGDTRRVLLPLGLAMKGGVWYLVAVADASPSPARTYRVGRIVQCDVGNQTFTPPPEFDLEAYWRDQVMGFKRDTATTEEAVIRLSPNGLKVIPLLGDAAAKRAYESASPADADGWVTATIPIERIPYTAKQLLSLGPEVVVIEPAALAVEVRRRAEEIAALY